MFSPFEAEFGPYRILLEQLAQEVRDEVSLALSQAQSHEALLQAREREDASTGREIFKRFRKLNLQEQEDTRRRRLEKHRQKLEKHRLKFLSALSIYDHEKAYKQARRECVVDTSTWIPETPEFEDWMLDSWKTLWFTGRCKRRLEDIVHGC